MSVLPESFAAGGPWTEQSYFALPEDNARIELLDGALLVNPPPTFAHQWLCHGLTRAINRACPAGVLAVPGVGVRMGTDRILIPDVAVVSVHDLRIKVFDPADVLLAVEIVSPGSVASDRAIKPLLYAQANIPTYLRIEQTGPTAHVFRLVGDHYEIESSGTLLRLHQPFDIEVDLVALLQSEEAE